MRRPSLALAAVLPLLACATFSARRQETLTKDARVFNDNYRWQRFEHVVGYLPVAERRPFLDRVAAVGDDIRLEEVEVTAIDFGAKNEKATVTVRLEWFSQRENMLRRATIVQQWEWIAERWVCTEQRRVRGDRFALVLEPVRPPDGGAPGGDAAPPG